MKNSRLGGVPLPYKLLDSGLGLKLEDVGGLRLVRPAPQALWAPSLEPSEWEKDLHGVFKRRGENGVGSWVVSREPKEWVISAYGISLNIRLTDFGHIGLFPEHLVQGEVLASYLKRTAERRSQPFRLLHLFAYTGAVTIQAALAGAHVTHVDASRGSVAWAKENAKLNGLRDTAVRWIVEDVQKFVQREKRRGALYDGIILDPPSFGRGTQGEVWKIEDHLLGLLEDLAGLGQPEFFQISCHSQGLSPLALSRLLAVHMPQRATLKHQELILPQEDERKQKRKNGGEGLPSGSVSFYRVDAL